MPSSPDVPAARAQIEAAAEALAAMGPLIDGAGTQDRRLKDLYRKIDASIKSAYRSLDDEP